MVNRTTEEPYIETTITSLLKEYVYLDIKAYLGTTFEEYLDLTPVIRNVYIKFLEPIADEKRIKLEELNNTKDGIQGVADDYGL